MRTITLVSGLLVAVLMLLDAPQPANADCCGSLVTLVTKYIEGIGPVQLREQSCGDCTSPTPYCGYGPCNIFGCSCEGGCRNGDCNKKRRADDESSNYNAKAIVKAGDTNGDGELSYREAQSLLKRHGKSARMDELKALDSNLDGKLSAEEIDTK